METLRDVFADVEPHSIVEKALEDLSNAPDYLFDSVHTVEMDRWHKGRVVLVGDSAWCLTLFSGMGATAGLMGGQQLGEALAAQNGNVPAALKSWEGACAPTLKNSARPCGSNRRCSCHRTGFSGLSVHRHAHRLFWSQRRCGEALHAKGLQYDPGRRRYPPLG